MSHSLEFFDDPSDFLVAAEPLLSARPVPSTVVATVSHRISRDDLTERPAAGAPPRWWALVKEPDGSIAGAGMRTAPYAPHAPYLLSMPEPAARLLARAVHERGEAITAVNGWQPTIQVFAEETAALTGGTVRAAEQMYLYELGDLIEPPRPPGRLRQARIEETDLVLSWFDAFSPDASAQAGRSDPHPSPIESRESTAARITAGEVWLWDDPDGVPVHVTAFNPTSHGVARIGPVYTPAEGRGRGYAAAAVADIARRLLAEGAQVCLFADRDNPVSTALYERLGFRAVGETGALVID